MDIYKRALKTWGKEPQMLQVIEEMSELIKEILKMALEHLEHGTDLE